MSTRLELLDGVLVARYDDTTRTVTTYNVITDRRGIDPTHPQLKKGQGNRSYY